MASPNHDSGEPSNHKNGDVSNVLGKSWERQEEQKVNDQQASFAQQAAFSHHNAIYPIPYSNYSNFTPHQGHGAAFLHQQPPFQDPPVPSQTLHYGMNSSFLMQDPPYDHQFPNSPAPVPATNTDEVNHVIDVFVRQGFQEFMPLLGHYQHDPHFMVALAHTSLSKYKDSQIRIDRVVARLRQRQKDEEKREKKGEQKGELKDERKDEQKGELKDERKDERKDEQKGEQKDEQKSEQKGEQKDEQKDEKKDKQKDEQKDEQNLGDIKLINEIIGVLTRENMYY